MSHRNNDPQLQSIQSMMFWGWFLNSTQRNKTNNLLEQNNQLLEQIRRQGLTPAERAAEDAQRKAKLAAEKARREAQDKAVGLALLLLVAILFAFGLFQSVASVASPTRPVAPIPMQQTVAPQLIPTSATASTWTDEDVRRFHDETLNAPPTHPRAELVRLPHRHR
jgi:hypothetical protein